ncbi:hypothetical protein [Ornithinimicrobium pratense]|uniref:Uncharacterized protein n=1 Tax=Ornithinimicrobium pratense TaxID=2593973 RepID=A0A5J6V4U2_9MICO|nr:hypothetical protein [Ornithinimicrobium pratense]QFG68092.1 hypothetical protein FY030_04615 [Ornithinimicrobium pratense]
MLTDAIVLVGLGVVAILLPLSSGFRSWQVDDLARRVGARVRPGLRPVLEVKLTRRTRGVGVGILLGGLALLLLALLWPGEPPLDGGGWLVVSLVVVLGAGGTVVAELRHPGVPGEGPRAARARTPGFSDYVPRQAAGLTGGLVMGGVLALLGTLLLGGSQWFSAEVLWRSPVPVLVVALVVLTLLSWWAAHRVLDAPQPAADVTELYWQDALRANTLTGLLMPLVIVALLGLSVCGAALDEAATRVATEAGQVGPAWSMALLVAGYVLPFVIVVTLLGTSPWWARPQAGEHFRSRLWQGRSADDLEARV